MSKTETKIENLKLENIFPSKTNPRKSFDEKGLQELAESIKEYGLLQPILVRPILDDFDKDLKPNYEIIYGERRYRASVLAKMTTIKAQIEYMDDDKAFEIQVLENLQREDVSPLDEARAFHSLMKKESLDWLASKINKSKKYVLDRVKLLDLCDYAMETLEAGVLPIGHAVLLSKIDKGNQDKIMKGSGVIMNINMSKDKNDYTHSYCTKTLSVLKCIISETMLSFDKSNFDLNDENLLPKAGSCQACPKRTINENLLFGDITHKDMCTDSLCFNAKIKQQLEVNLEKAKNEFGSIQVGEKDKWSSHKIILKGGKEAVYFKEEKINEYIIPVMINKTDNWSARYLGKTVWIEDKSKVIEETEEPKEKTTSYWQIQDRKEFDEIVIPRIKQVILKTREDIDLKYTIANQYLIERLVDCKLKHLLVIAHFLKLRPLEDLSLSHIQEFLKDKSKQDDYQMCFEIANEILESYTMELVLVILAIDDIIHYAFEDNEEVPEWELTLNKIYSLLGLSTGAEVEVEVEEIPAEQSITERVKERAKKLK